MAIATCHSNRFAHCKGLCKSCYDKHLKQINPGYKERQKNINSEWFKRNPEAKLRARLKRQAKERANPLIRREALLKHKYGLNLISYDLLLKQQNGCCAICFRKPGTKPLHVDHDHITNKVRGLLCHQCNWYLGSIDRDIKIISRIISYLGLSS